MEQALRPITLQTMRNPVVAQQARTFFLVQWHSKG